MLLWALKQFLTFIQESGAVSKKQAEKMMHSAVKVCDSILDKQIEQIEQLEAPNYLSWYILDGLQRKIIREVSLSDLQSKKRLPDYYYVHIKHDDAVYMRTEVLYRYLNEKTPLHLASSKAMNKQLIDEDILHLGKERRAADKKIDGRRYLELRRADLISAAADVHYNE